MIIKYMLIILIFIGLLLWIYQIIISLKGFSSPTILPKATSFRNFAILIPAKNEEKVIGNLIESLLLQSYPKEYFDIYVSCDNCTDLTSKIAKQKRTVVLEQSNEISKGKTWNIKWALQHINLHNYDSIIIFDADNVVDLHFLTEMNNYLEEHPKTKAIQGRLESKNPIDSWITQLYTLTYWYQNRFWSLAREKWRLSTFLGGTGMLIRVPFLEKLGWNAKSLAEDLEMSSEFILNGEIIHWNYFSVSYDEKPAHLNSSLKQRRRWLQGHVWVLKKYGFQAMKKGLIERKIQLIDLFFTLFFPGKTALIYGLIVFTIPLVLINLFVDDNLFLYSSLIWFLIAILQLVLILIVSPSIMLKRITFKYWYLIFGIILYSVLWVPSFIKGFLNWRNQTIWYKTEHHSTVKIEDLRD